MASFLDLFKKRQDSSAIFDVDFVDENLSNTFLKEIALNIVLDFVARSVAQSDFRIYRKGKIVRDEASYLLNVRPNPNESATQFWRKLVRRLLKEGEVLVVQSDTKDLFIADSFVANEVVLFPRTFSGVTVDSYTFTRSFSMDDVWYFKYSNKKLRTYVNDLSNELNNLFNRIAETAKRNNQLRAIVDVDATLAGSDEDENRTRLQGFIDKAYKAINTNSVAIIPQTKGFTYEEKSSSEGVGKESVDQLKILQDQLIDTVANLVGVPPALIHGQNEKLDSNIKSYLDFCINPLLKEIQDELNAKLFLKEDYLKGDNVKIIGLNKKNIFDVATSIDKVVSSSVVNPNEVRNELGYEPREDGDKYVITKNYDKEQDLKGGDKNESNSD